MTVTSMDAHRLAGRLMDMGYVIAADSNRGNADLAWEAAARMEMLAFELCSEDLTRTRGVVATSCVHLFRKAGLDDLARSAARMFMDAGSMTDDAIAELREFVQ